MRDGGRCRYTAMGCMIHTGERRLHSGNGSRMFTEAEIQMIRADPRPAPAVARMLGVSDSTIRHIRQLRIYKDVA